MSLEQVWPIYFVVRRHNIHSLRDRYLADEPIRFSTSVNVIC